MISSARARADTRSAYVLTSAALVTHDEMKHVAVGQRKALCNLKHMATKIAGEKKSSSRPSKVRHCLVAETDDEDEDDDRLITW